MVEFNSDGSLKMQGKMENVKNENENKMRVQKCLRVKRDVVSFKAPKKCILHLTLSKAFFDDRFVKTIYGYFKERASTPNKLIQIGEREFDVEIGTDFRRCTDCQSLINEFREFLHGNIIDVKGNCTFEGQMRNFAYEDYFD